MSMPQTTVFEALYSPQLHQKRKKWYDGTCKYDQANRKLVLSDDNQATIAECFWTREAAPAPDTATQIDRFLVELIAIIGHESSALPSKKRRVPLDYRYKPRDWGPSFDQVFETMSKPMENSAVTRDIFVSEDVPAALPRATALLETTLPLESSLPESSLPETTPENDTPIDQFPSLSELFDSSDELEFVSEMKHRKPRKSPYEKIPDNPPTTGPWTKEAYLLFAWNPPLPTTNVKVEQD